MIRPIRNQKQYREALGRIRELLTMEPKVGSVEGDELDVLSLLVEVYEEKHYLIPPPHPVDAIKFRLEQLGLQTSDLQPILGTKSRVSEVMNGKRKLSLQMIRRLHEVLQIPLESLVTRY